MMAEFCTQGCTRLWLEKCSFDELVLGGMLDNRCSNRSHGLHLNPWPDLGKVVHDGQRVIPVCWFVFCLVSKDPDAILLVSSTWLHRTRIGAQPGVILASCLHSHTHKGAPTYFVISQGGNLKSFASYSPLPPSSYPAKKKRDGSRARNFLHSVVASQGLGTKHFACGKMEGE